MDCEMAAVSLEAKTMKDNSYYPCSKSHGKEVSLASASVGRMSESLQVHAVAHSCQNASNAKCRQAWSSLADGDGQAKTCY